MPVPPDTIIQLLRSAFPDATIHLEDTMGDNDHYTLTITDEAFRGQPRIIQHRMVFKALENTVGSTLHALALHTLIPK